MKDQVLDQLPDKVECVLRCSLSGWQKHIYHSVQVCVNIYMYMYDSVCISQINLVMESSYFIVFQNKYFINRYTILNLKIYNLMFFDVMHKRFQIFSR